MKVLVLGGCGFIGSHLTERLIEDKHEVTVIDNLSTGKYIPECHFIHADIRTCPLSGDYDVIFHLAARASIPDSFHNPTLSHAHNVNGTLRIIEFARHKKIPIIFSGSSAIYDEGENVNPVSPYALQKLIGEQYLKLYYRAYGLKSVILRYFSVYGERQPDYSSYQTVLS
ncbi:MAG: NAD-dependent epimerase/dehydratase family protein, partial [Nanoarchaeota archaeon]